MKDYLDDQGRLHRENGPAMEWDDGTKFWCIHGKYSRDDGPASEWADGRKFWWVDDLLIMKTNGDVTEAQLKEFRLRKIK